MPHSVQTCQLYCEHFKKSKKQTDRQANKLGNTTSFFGGGNNSNNKKNNIKTETDFFF